MMNLAKWSPTFVLLTASIALANIVTPAAGAKEAEATKPDAIGPDGTVTVPSFRLPPSDYMSEQAKAALPRAPTDMFDVLRRSPEEIVAFRNEIPRLAAGRLSQLTRMYQVATRTGSIAGVPAAWAEPAAGIAAAKSGKILLNLPGGGFAIANAAGSGLLESIPLAGIMGVQVVSITYRQGPEARYPAATEDVLKVYREILKTHRAEDVVIFGCSAGGFLTAQSVSALIRDKLPLPAAIGILCASADLRLQGDSAAFNAPFHAVAGAPVDGAYLKGVDLNDPAVSPILSPDLLKRFPPTLLLTSGRTLELSSAIATNNALEKAGAVSQLNLWDGLDHAFFYDPTLPESREAFEVMARFFGKYLRLSR